jgi:hypothetical protein
VKISGAVSPEVFMMLAFCWVYCSLMSLEVARFNILIFGFGFNETLREELFKNRGDRFMVCEGLNAGIGFLSLLLSIIISRCCTISR